ERDHGQARATDDLVHEHVVQERHALAAALARMAQRPEALLLGRLHELAHDLPALLAAALLDHVLVRIPAFLDEAPGAARCLPDVLWDLERHDPSRRWVRQPKSDGEVGSREGPCKMG